MNGIMIKVYTGNNISLKMKLQFCPISFPETPPNRKALWRKNSDRANNIPICKN